MFQTTNQYMVAPVAPVAPWFFFPDPALTLSESKELLDACRSRMLESGTGIWSKTMGTEAIGDPPNMGILVALLSKNGGIFPSFSQPFNEGRDAPTYQWRFQPRGTKMSMTWISWNIEIQYHTHMLHCAEISYSTVVYAKTHPVF